MVPEQGVEVALCFPQSDSRSEVSILPRSSISEGQQETPAHLACTGTAADLSAPTLISAACSPARGHAAWKSVGPAVFPSLFTHVALIANRNSALQDVTIPTDNAPDTSRFVQQRVPSVSPCREGFLPGPVAKNAPLNCLLLLATGFVGLIITIIDNYIIHF